MRLDKMNYSQLSNYFNSDQYFNEQLFRSQEEKFKRDSEMVRLMNDRAKEDIKDVKAFLKRAIDKAEGLVKNPKEKALFTMELYRLGIFDIDMALSNINYAIEFEGIDRDLKMKKNFDDINGKLENENN